VAEPGAHQGPRALPSVGDAPTARRSHPSVDGATGARVVRSRCVCLPSRPGAAVGAPRRRRARRRSAGRRGARDLRPRARRRRGIPPDSPDAATGAPRALSSAAARAESALRRSETRSLGAEHAAEHAAQRAGLRAWAATPPKARARAIAATRKAAASANAATGPADEVGRWSTTRVDLPTWAVNATVLPTGGVAYWGRGALATGVGGTRENSAPFYVWDPETGRSTRHDLPQETIDLDGDGAADDLAPAPIFCSGQSLLPTGELFVAGGNAFYPEYGSSTGGGHADFGGWTGTYSFDPWTAKWTRQPRMRHGRWYPSQQVLPDGRTIIASGYDEHGDGADNEDLEVFTAGRARGDLGTIARSEADARRTEGFYPHMQVLPGGKVAYVGQYRRDTRLLDPSRLFGTGAWTDGPYTRANQRVGGSAALLPGTSRMMILGGFGADWDDPASVTRPFDPATASAESTDLRSGDRDWTADGSDPVPDLDRPRSYGQLVGLPDGGFAYVGGGAGFRRADGLAGNNATEGRQELKSVALWKPGESSWRTGPAQAKWRSYHSTAVLLPDGRVLSAGDDYWNFADRPDQGKAPAGRPQDQGEIYEPAYLFDGDRRAPRPAVVSGPSAVRWGAPFGVGVTEVDRRPIVRATLVAPDAVTHGTNMNRAFAELPVQRVAGKGVNVVAPAGRDLAPPGWYMLFLWDDAGTPAEARWVQLRADAPNAPLLTADDGSPGAPGGGSGGGGTPGGGSGDGGAGAGGSGDGGGSGAGAEGGAGGGSETPGPATGTPAPPPAARDRRAPRVVVAAPRPSRRASTVRLRVGADEPGRVVVRVRALGREQRRTVRLTSRRLSTTVTVRLDTRARRTLRAGRVLRLRVRTTATDAAGNAATRTTVLRLRSAGR